jgi:two-component system nitrate/nitrite sensor histidine kinase NarX
MPCRCASCARAGFESLVSVPIRLQHRLLGEFDLFFRSPVTLSAEETALLDALASHLASALEGLRAAALEREAAVGEERALLARELHDSIAQSLAFMKIQVQLLRTAAQREQPDKVRTAFWTSWTLGCARASMMCASCWCISAPGPTPRHRAGAAGDPAEVRTPDGPAGTAGCAWRRTAAAGGRAGAGAACGAGSPVQRAQARRGLPCVAGGAQGPALALRGSRQRRRLQRQNQVRGESHVGLKIMRERAARIGGEVEITSAPGRHHRDADLAAASGGDRQTAEPRAPPDAMTTTVPTS